EPLAAYLFAAIERNLPRLSELVEAEQERTRALEGPTPGSVGQLFPQPLKAERHRGEPRVTLGLDAPTANIAVLDQLVEQHRAANRSQFLTAILRAELE